MSRPSYPLLSTAGPWYPHKTHSSGKHHEHHRDEDRGAKRLFPRGLNLLIEGHWAGLLASVQLSLGSFQGVHTKPWRNQPFYFETDSWLAEN